MSQHELERLLPRHFQIVDLCLGGHGTKEIAQAMEMTPQAISLITNSPLFQAELSRRRTAITSESDTQLAMAPTRAKDVLENAQIKAANTVVGLLDYPDASIQLKASNSILDRVISTMKENDRPVIQINIAEMNILREALRETSSVVACVVAESSVV